MLVSILRNSSRLSTSLCRPEDVKMLRMALFETNCNETGVVFLVPPLIIIPPKPRIFLNESDRLLLFCNASGVPKPTIQWSCDEILLRNTGDLLSINYVKYSNAGTYTCTASNGIEPNVTAKSVVTIYCKYTSPS